MAAISKKELSELIKRCAEAFKDLPRMIEVVLLKGESLVVVGDTHGDIDVVKAIVQQFLDTGDALQTGSASKKTRLLFLGDYVDRDERDVENLAFILNIALKYPEHVMLLRGNHEEILTNTEYGFIDHLEFLGLQSLYPAIERLFTMLPLACYVSPLKVFCCHGMIPVASGGVRLADITRLHAAAKLDQWDPITAQLLWSDPDPGEKSISTGSPRGLGLFVGKNDFDDFIKANQLRLIVRSHQVFAMGYRFFFQRRILSIFSKPNYEGGNNAACIARLYAYGGVEVLTMAFGEARFTVSDTLKID